MREDKGQNRTVIEWLERAEPDRPFLVTEKQTWTYAQSRIEVERRMADEPRVSTPSLDANSVFDLIAGMAGGGVMVLGPRIDPRKPSGAAALVAFTSGTTGPPKGVRLTMENLTAAAEASAGHLGHGPDDTWLLAMPLHHVGGITILVRQAWTGGTVRLLPRFDPPSYATALGGSTMVSVVPTMLRRLVGHGPFDGLKAVLVGGGPIPDGLLEAAAAIGLPVLPTYGMTETFGQVATLRPGSRLERKAHPLPGVDLRIESTGRIAVRGRQVSPGYLDEPDREDPWLETNDLGTLDDDGALRVIGRADSVIVTGGENVNPEHVESVVSQHPDVSGVIVVGVFDDEWGELVACVYTGAVKESDLVAWVTERLPGFMVPRRWLVVEDMPRTPMGKPDRVAALALCLDADG